MKKAMQKYVLFQPWLHVLQLLFFLSTEGNTIYAYP